MPFDIDKHDTLRNISSDEDGEVDATYKELANWYKKRKQNDFPAPVRRVGRYLLFDIEEVKEWVVVWRKVTRRVGRGKELNAERTSS